ncbi:DMT family transporter [Streptomyces odontomachi]|uniref:DMT family transporter n=1 Tax=Streptomyces odontomachi TaxID=2944940 RepID=UPI00210E94A4|nr:DMT family transporter [Streptomyces sp. ODS25]
MSDLALAVLLSLISAVAYAGGAIVQERVAADAPAMQYAPLRRPVWWAAVGLNGLGALLHVAALAFGPLSLVQPSGALTIVFALPMAALFVGRRAGATAWRGAVMATVGLAGLLSLTSASDSQSLSGPERMLVALITAGLVVALMVSAHAAHRHPAVRSVLLAAAAGVAFGIGSVFTKTVALDWTGGTSLTLRLPSLLVIAVLATAGMLLSQASYRGAGLTAPLSMVTVANPVVAAAVGLTMFGEGFRYGWAGTISALACGVLAAGGVVLLTMERVRSSAVPPAGASPALPEPRREHGSHPAAGSAAAQDGSLPPGGAFMAVQDAGGPSTVVSIPSPARTAPLPQQPSPGHRGTPTVPAPRAVPVIPIVPDTAAELTDPPGATGAPGVAAESDLPEATGPGGPGSAAGVSDPRDVTGLPGVADLPGLARSTAAVVRPAEGPGLPEEPGLRRVTDLPGVRELPEATRLTRLPLRRDSRHRTPDGQLMCCARLRP